MHLQQLVPQAHDRTRVITRFMPYPLPTEGPAFKRLMHRIVRPFVTAGVAYYARRIQGEDIAVVEHQQQNCHNFENIAHIAAQEERIGWFEQVYARHVGNLPPF